MEVKEEPSLRDNIEYQKLGNDQENVYSLYQYMNATTKKTDTNPLNNNNGIILNEKLEEQGILIQIDNENSFENSIENFDNNNKTINREEEEGISDENMKSINKVSSNSNSNGSKKKKSKTKSTRSKKKKLFIIQKQRGPRAKNPNKKFKHNSGYYDNRMFKIGRLFLNSIRFLLNHRCGKYTYNGLKKIKFVKVYGFGYQRHKEFLQSSMGDIFSSDAHNKKIIDFVVQKDMVFDALMKTNVKTIYGLYQNNIPFIKIEGEEGRFHLEKFISLEKAIDDRKKNGKENPEKLDKLYKDAKKFIESIYEERGRKKINIKYKK